MNKGKSKKGVDPSKKKITEISLKILKQTKNEQSMNEPPPAPQPEIIENTRLS